ncbi:MAG: GIY-YIG nuclease family protein, partial [Bacteroidales bacterium]|nr:GIY-YIG nuclease family protein [Bacteroidales bacterium]
FFCIMTYHFYILHSATNDKLYIGHTSQLEERLQKHNSNHKGFTGNSSDWQVVYKEIYETKAEAYARERQVKAWKSRRRIKEMVEKSNGKTI